LIRKNLFILLTTIVLLGGCIAVPAISPLVAGGAGAAGAYSVTTDSVTDNFNVSKERAFEVVMDILKREGGIITQSSLFDGTIRGEYIGRKIRIVIKAYNEKQVKVMFEARKGFNLLPDSDTAVKLYRMFSKEVKGE